MEQTDSCQWKRGREEWGKEGEGIRQRTCMNDPRTWTTWGLTVGVGCGLGGGVLKGKYWDTSNRINKNLNKVKIKEIENEEQK